MAKLSAEECALVDSNWLDEAIETLNSLENN